MYSDNKTIEEFVCWLQRSFPKLAFVVKQPLYELFPEPSKYKSFWKNKNAHIDISVFRHGKLVCAIEPGGFQHLTDRKQMARDKKKSFICKENGVSFLPLMNSCLKEKEDKEFKKLLKFAFYSEKKDG